jgi:hypothetical protein
MAHKEDRPAWITEPMARQAVIAIGHATSWPEVVQYLMNKHGHHEIDFGFAAAGRIIVPLLDEYWGTYVYVDQSGAISEPYVGVASALEAAHLYPSTEPIMLSSGHTNTFYPQEVVRYLRAFPDAPDTVVRLLDLLLTIRPNYREGDGFQERVLEDARCIAEAK